MCAMDIRFINEEVIREILTPDRCIELMDQAMRQVSLGQADLPLRTAMPLPNGNGMLGMMPGFLGACGDQPDCFGIKLNSLFPGNPAVGLPSHLGLVVLYEADNGKPICVLDADVITSLRTAAASGLATRELARPDSSTLAIIGTGEEARTHIPAMMAVRDITDIIVWGRNPAHARALCDEFSGLQDVTCSSCDSVEEAVSHADIICTVTASPDPVLKGAWIPDGAHVNLVGSSVPTDSEVDTEAVVRGRFYVDYRISTMNQAGELLAAIDEGAVDDSHIIGEIGAVLLREVPGRLTESEITIYKSLGVSAQDLASSWYLYEQAGKLGLGQVVQM
jgi:ornithine cyclodeaminase